MKICKLDSVKKPKCVCATLPKFRSARAWELMSAKAWKRKSAGARERASAEANREEGVEARERRIAGVQNHLVCRAHEKGRVGSKESGSIKALHRKNVEMEKRKKP